MNPRSKKEYLEATNSALFVKKSGGSYLFLMSRLTFS